MHINLVVGPHPPTSTSHLADIIHRMNAPTTAHQRNIKLGRPGNEATYALHLMLQNHAQKTTVDQSDSVPLRDAAITAHQCM